jgi:hypothetical protein
MGLREARGLLELIAKLGGELTAVEASRPIRPIFQLSPDARFVAVTVNHRVMPSPPEDDRPAIRNVTPEENPPEISACRQYLPGPS